MFIDMGNCNTNHLYIISFTAGGDSGLAFLSAGLPSDAVSLLRNTGRYNGTPDAYKIIQCRDIGMASSIRNELLLESYVNALVAFDAISAAITPYIGPKGEKGETGGFGVIDAEADSSVGIPSVEIISEGPNSAKNLHFVFHNIKGESGASVISYEQTQTSDEPGGVNEITVTLADGTESKVYIHNGDTGVDSVTAEVDTTFGTPSVVTSFEDGALHFSFSGIRGIQGNPGMNNTTMRVVELPLPTPSENTTQDVYLVYNDDTGDYDRYITQYDGEDYEWVQVGSLTINLSDYRRKDDDVWLTQEEFDALAVKDITKVYNIYEDIDEP